MMEFLGEQGTGWAHRVGTLPWEGAEFAVCLCQHKDPL